MTGSRRVGKISPRALERLILPHLGGRRPDVLVHAGLGEDAAVFDAGDSLVVISTDPITAAGEGIGWYATHIAMNDVAAGGARPLGILVTLILPPGCAEETVGALQQDIARAAAALGAEVLGGHTERSDAVTRPVVVATAVGLAGRGRLVGSSGGRPGDQLVLTKTAGLEGTAILATDYADRAAAVLSPEEMERARSLMERLSVVPEALAATAQGATAMHDVTEGGVMGAAWELARASGTGFVLDRRRVPLAPETAKLCAAFDLDPLRLMSSGALLVATPGGEALVEELSRTGIDATVVGELIARGFLVADSAGARELDEDFTPEDELFRLLDSWGA